MNYKKVSKNIIVEDKWRFIDYQSNKPNKISSSIQYLKQNIDSQYGGTTNFKATLVNEIMYTQSYVNSKEVDQMVKLKFEVSFDHLEYVGPTDGIVPVHKRIISQSLSDNQEILSMEQRAGFRFVERFLPNAVNRVGCYCCYGDGPNLDIKIETLDNGDLEIIYEVDFDFDASDYRHND
jgi:hypothetical protein